MLFSSFQYMMLFLPCVVLLSMLAKRIWGSRVAQGCILAASILFYTWSGPANLGYLVGSILVNWMVAKTMEGQPDPHRRKRLLKLGLVLNIGFLCVFKYANFLIATLWFTGPRHLHLPELEFPLGISFFTLTQVMYLVDCYEGLLPALRLFDHATFVTFFPYVISGPIAKAKRMVHQFGDFGGETGTRAAMVSEGLYLFTLGLFKKVVFADAFATIANLGFSSGTKYSALEAWTFSVTYTLQIYFDFSGYSDMAIGSAKMLGVDLPRNFDAPLRSKSIIEFWQRWHITLSQFITTYLYTPILKSFRRATLATASIATLLAMALAGLWHGPSWTFVIFGVLHGTALVVNQYWRKKKMPRLPAFASWLLTSLLVNVAFIFFRSPTVRDGVLMTLALVNPIHPTGLTIISASMSSFTARVTFAMFAGIILAFSRKTSEQLVREFRPTYRTSFAVAGMAVVCWLALTFNAKQPFLYFKF